MQTSDISKKAKTGKRNSTTLCSWSDLEFYSKIDEAHRRKKITDQVQIKQMQGVPNRARKGKINLGSCSKEETSVEHGG